MPIDPRRVLSDNLRAWMDYRKVSRHTLRATYLTGPKRGKPVSARSIGNMLSAHEGANSPSYDMIVAVCAKLDLATWQLVVPGRGPPDPPKLALTDQEIEQVTKLETLLTALERANIARRPPEMLQDFPGAEEIINNLTDGERTKQDVQQLRQARDMRDSVREVVGGRDHREGPADGKDQIGRAHV